jgi:glutaminyl-peptide cyclotransferase
MDYRALANQWSLTPNPPSAQSKFYHNRNPLSQISLFLLLDLLGSPNPSIPSYFPTTHWAYAHLSILETRLRSLSLLESTLRHSDQPFFPDINGTMGGGGISDDHLPFMSKGVEVLHVIPSPFPDVWHKMEDDAQHLDMPTVRDWGKIVCAFVLEWLDMMEVWDEPKEKEEGRRGRWVA